MYLELFHRNRIQNLGHFQAFTVKIKGFGIFEIFEIFLKNGCFLLVKRKEICKTLNMPKR